MRLASSAPSSSSKAPEGGPHGGTSEREPCFYCRTRPSAPEHAHRQTMSFVTSVSSFGLGYRAKSTEVEIARCRRCERRHHHPAALLVLLALWGAMAWLVHERLWRFDSAAEAQGWAPWGGALLVGGIAAGASFWLFERLVLPRLTGIPVQEDVSHHPIVKRLLDEGWVLGRPHPKHARLSTPKDRRE